MNNLKYGFPDLQGYNYLSTYISKYIMVVKYISIYLHNVVSLSTSCS